MSGLFLIVGLSATAAAITVGAVSLFNSEAKVESRISNEAVKIEPVYPSRGEAAPGPGEAAPRCLLPTSPPSSASRSCAPAAHELSPRAYLTDWREEELGGWR